MILKIAMAFPSLKVETRSRAWVNSPTSPFMNVFTYIHNPEIDFELAHTPIGGSD